LVLKEGSDEEIAVRDVDARGTLAECLELQEIAATTVIGVWELAARFELYPLIDAAHRFMTFRVCEERPNGGILDRTVSPSASSFPTEITSPLSALWKHFLVDHSSAARAGCCLIGPRTVHLAARAALKQKGAPWAVALLDTCTVTHSVARCASFRADARIPAGVGGECSAIEVAAPPTDGDLSEWRLLTVPGLQEAAASWWAREGPTRAGFGTLQPESKNERYREGGDAPQHDQSRRWILDLNNLLKTPPTPPPSKLESHPPLAHPTESIKLVVYDSDHDEAQPDGDDPRTGGGHMPPPAAVLDDEGDEAPALPEGAGVVDESFETVYSNSNAAPASAVRPGDEVNIARCGSPAGMPADVAAAEREALAFFSNPPAVEGVDSPIRLARPSSSNQLQDVTSAAAPAPSKPQQDEIDAAGEDRELIRLVLHEVLRVAGEALEAIASNLVPIPLESGDGADTPARKSPAAAAPYEVLQSEAEALVDTVEGLQQRLAAAQQTFHASDTTSPVPTLTQLNALLDRCRALHVAVSEAIDRRRRVQRQRDAAVASRLRAAVLEKERLEAAAAEGRRFDAYARAYLEAAANAMAEVETITAQALKDAEGEINAEDQSTQQPPFAGDSQNVDVQNRGLAIATRMGRQIAHHVALLNEQQQTMQGQLGEVLQLDTELRAAIREEERALERLSRRSSEPSPAGAIGSAGGDLPSSRERFR
jgi:hypothetical protein